MQSFPLWEEEDGEEQAPDQAESRRQEGERKQHQMKGKRKEKKLNSENEFDHQTWVKQVLIQQE